MDFLDPQKKRKHAVRLFIGYALMAIALLLATTLLLFAALGYGIDRSTGEVIQNGLVFVDAHPESAKMLLNGQDKGQTDGRFVLEAGKYSLDLQRDGYRPWRKDFVVEGGGIVRLVYPFLFPNTLVSRDLGQYATTPDIVTESPDRHWIVTHRPADMRVFQVVDSSTKQNASVPISIPAAVLGTHTGQKLEFTEWSTDNKHFLVKYLYDGGYDYLIVDREAPENTVNISQVMNRGYTSVTLRDKRPEEIYAYDANGGVLQSITLKDKVVTSVASRVLSFWPYKDNTVVYVSDQGTATGKVNVHIKDGPNDYLLRELVAGPKYLLNMAEFDSNTYVTVGSVADGKQYIYKNPLTALKRDDASLNIPLLLLKLDNPDNVSFSANTRFIALQAGAKFEVYDAETKQRYRFDTQLAVDPGQKANWMDGHRLTLVSGGKLHVFEFDNANHQTLLNTNPLFGPLFDRDFTAMFTFGPTPNDETKFSLVRTELKVLKK